MGKNVLSSKVFKKKLNLSFCTFHPTLGLKKKLKKINMQRLEGNLGLDEMVAERAQVSKVSTVSTGWMEDGNSWCVLCTMPTCPRRDVGWLGRRDGGRENDVVNRNGS